MRVPSGVEAPAASPPIEVRGLVKRFGRRVVLDGVDLVVRPGELVALVGENGAGKSTLVACIAGRLTLDAGTVQLADGDDQVAVVWQDLALCDNLDAVANLFLGRERGGAWLSDVDMHAAARARLDELGIAIDDLRRPVAALSRGQRQSLAIARALLDRPQLLVLDEPTAALSVTETRTVERIVREVRNAGCAVLLISHRIEQVFALADRILVLRNGRVVGDLATVEVHPDDVVALMLGTETDTTARKQLRRLRSLVDQLAEVEPSASIPLIVSALSGALGVEQVCVHLLDPSVDGVAPMLTRRATVGVRDALLNRNELLPVGLGGGIVGLAAELRAAVVTEDVRRHPAWAGFRTAAAASGVLSAWAVPIAAADGVLGVISAYADAVGRPQPAQLELVSVYTNLAVAAIERERLLAEVTRRNRILEALRGMLETLTGPEAHGGMVAALATLCRGLGADAVAMLSGDADAPGSPTWRASTDASGAPPPEAACAELESAAVGLWRTPTHVDRARPVGSGVVAVPLATPQGDMVLAAWWARPEGIGNDALDLLDDAARSLCLAVEREEMEIAHAETETLRRAQRLQRDFLSRLSHELRTPLTAIQGYASTLRQTDVRWDEASEERFLGMIVSESARMGRLVGDLLDTSALEAGGLRLDCDWCDLELAIEAAAACVPGGTAATIVEVAPGVPLVWADHDRLEQVVVNLVDNALRHGAPAGRVHIAVDVDDHKQVVTIRVTDDGPGLAADLAERVFEPYVRGDTAGPGAGLGLAITKGIVTAHGGTIAVEPTANGTTIRIALPVEPGTTVER